MLILFKLAPTKGKQVGRTILCVTDTPSALPSLGLEFPSGERSRPPHGPNTFQWLSHPVRPGLRGQAPGLARIRTRDHGAAAGFSGRRRGAPRGSFPSSGWALNPRLPLLNIGRVGAPGLLSEKVSF